MDRWMDGSVDGWMDAWMMDGWMGRWAGTQVEKNQINRKQKVESKKE